MFSVLSWGCIAIAPILPTNTAFGSSRFDKSSSHSKASSLSQLCVLICIFPLSKVRAWSSINYPPGIIKFIPASSVPISHAMNDLCLSITSLTNGAYACPADGTAVPENPRISSGSDLLIWRMWSLFAVFESNIKMLAPMSKRAIAYLSPASGRI